MPGQRRIAGIVAFAIAGLLITALVVPASASSGRGFSSRVSHGIVSLRGSTGADSITLSARSGRLRHDAGAGDAFAGAFDFDTNRTGVQSVRVANLRLVRVLGGAGNDDLTLAGGRGYPSLDVDGGPGTDTVRLMGDVRSRGSIGIVADRIGMGAKPAGRSPFTIAANFTTGGAFSVSTADSGPGPGDDNITVNAGVSVTAGTTISFQSADAIVLQPGSSLKATNQYVYLATDVGNTDAAPNGNLLADGSIQANSDVTIVTGPGDDLVRLAGPITGSAASALSTGTGNDTIRVEGSTVFPGTLDGGGNTDWLDFSNAGSGVTADLAGGAGNRFAGAFSNVENVTGSSHDDHLSGSAGANVIAGGDGLDTLSGAGGDDRLFGGKGVDSADGGTGNDFVSAGGGGDTVHGGDNDDVIRGLGGADTLVGDLGADSIDGGSGGDHLDGADGVSGNDTLDGRAGADTCTADAGDTEVSC